MRLIISSCLLTVATLLSGCASDHNPAQTDLARNNVAVDTLCNEMHTWPLVRDTVVLKRLKSNNGYANPLFEDWLKEQIGTRIRQNGVRPIYEPDWNKNTHDIDAVIEGAYTITNSSVYISLHAVAPSPSGKSVSGITYQLPLSADVLATLNPGSIDTVR